MGSLNHLTPKKVQKVANQLGDVRSGLKGLSSLFLFQSSDVCYDPDELAGVGHLISGVSNQLMQLEDILRCGYDSVTKAEIERDYEDEPYYDEEEETTEELPNNRRATPLEQLIERLIPNLEELTETIAEKKIKESL